MITLGLSHNPSKENLDALRTFRLRCLTCGTEVQACGPPRYCRCDSLSGAQICISGTVYDEGRYFGPTAKWENAGR